jgi:hypothetical protein
MHYVYLLCTQIVFFEDLAGRKPISMVKKSPSKDEALEALDFIINVLKEHEKDLDRLINELGKITSSVGETGAVSEKMERVEERLSTLQSEINNLVGCLSPSSKPITARPVSSSMSGITSAGPAVIVRCKQWEDFKTLAKGSDTVSFIFRDTEKGFQADALKDGRVLTYSGEIPKDGKLLKFWLARELEIKEEKIFEGVLSIG